MKHGASSLGLREPSLSDESNRGLPISLDEALQRVVADGRSLLMPGEELIIDTLPEHLADLFHFFISVGRNIHEESFIDFAGLIILQSV
jgi:hypothetical protein